jgi:hypothetical protein
MATIDLRTPEARAAFGLSDTPPAYTVQAPSKRRKAAADYRDRADTAAMILEAVAASAVPMTRAQIARALNRSRTPYLISVIDELVFKFELEQSRRFNKWQKFEYVYVAADRGGHR